LREGDCAICTWYKAIRPIWTLKLQTHGGMSRLDWYIYRVGEGGLHSESCQRQNRMFKHTWRDRIVRTNRTAPTTRYFSLLRVSNKILSITLLGRKLHLQKAETHVHNYMKWSATLSHSNYCLARRKYFILYGWCKIQKHSKSHMFDSISGFVPLWYLTRPRSIDLLFTWATFSERHDAVITSISWPRCFS